ncbi:hypothetical protein [Hydrotalea sp.]|jgi:hypothetical protein|uniref:hypothetical protein n=1 Tax=Hydrotalea sp. TaxID=2881279 RepID=UPI00176A6182
MLTDKEEKFIQYWAENGEKQKHGARSLLKGFSLGMSIGAAIILLIAAGWYERADMEAHSKLNPFFLLFIILILAIFMAFLYRNYRWEMNQQYYLELLAKQKRINKNNSPNNQNSTNNLNTIENNP